MRTFSAEAQAALDSGKFQPYLRVLLSDVDPSNFDVSVQPVSFRIQDHDAEAVLPITAEVTGIINSGYFAFERGVVIGGVPETTVTSSFTPTQILQDEKYYYIKGSLLPPHYKNLGIDLTWQEVIEAIYLDELNPTTKIIAATYENAAHAVWGYQFYPTGRNVIFHNLQSLHSIFRQKFLIFARHTENSLTDKIDVYFFQPTETISVQHEIDDLLFQRDKSVLTTQFVVKQFLWRDDAMTVNTYNPTSASGYLPPIHNLGYIPTTGTRPAYAHSLKAGRSSRLSPNLKYESGDYVTINGYNYSFNTRIKVTEIFDTELTPAWHVIVEPFQWFENTEGGAMPSTVEAAAPYTPLNTSTFNNNLDATVNNLQALAEAVDDLVLGGTDEEVQDLVGAMLTGNTETGITVTYQDADGTIDFVTDVVEGDIREKLTANRTYYVRTDGSDSNTGLVDSAGGAFLTIQKAVDVVQTLDVAGFTVTIQVADGTYTGAVTLANVVGWSVQGNLVLQGNTTTPANCIISTTSNNCIAHGDITGWDVKGFKLQTTTSGSCLSVTGGTLRLSNIDFGACLGSHIAASSNAIVQMMTNYAISGGAAAHLDIQADGFYNAATRTITFLASVTFGSSFAFVSYKGQAWLHGMTFTLGAFAVTAKRYTGTGNGVIFVNGGGANYLPGNVAGTTATGAQYF